MQVSKQRTKSVFEYNYQEIRNRNRALMQTENREGRLSSKTGFFEDPYGVVQKVSEGKRMQSSSVSGNLIEVMDGNWVRKNNKPLLLFLPIFLLFL